MRVHKIGLTGVLGAVCCCLAGCTTPSSQQDPVLEEMKAIRATLDMVTNQLAQMETEQQKLRSFTSRYNPSPGSDVNITKLADITLPENASQEEAEKYIEKIMAATEGQRSFSTMDPQISLYAEVGQENLPLLIKALSGGPYHMQSDIHLVPAISKLADESSKALILDALPAHQGLIQVITDKGWEQDAHDILISELEKGRQLPANWIQAVALLDDPESYPLLRDYFIKAGNRSSTYKAIANLPIEDMPGAVEKAWKESQFDHDYERRQMAMIAAEYGHIDALAYLIETLKNPTDQFSNFVQQQIRLTVFKLTGTGGSSEDQTAWFRTNKDRLQFDPESKKYGVAPEKASLPSGEE